MIAEKYLDFCILRENKSTIFENICFNLCSVGTNSFSIGFYHAAVLVFAFTTLKANGESFFNKEIDSLMLLRLCKSNLTAYLSDFEGM